MQELVILGLAMLATGCVAGVLAGLFGIGGGIVIVPALEYVLGLLGVDPAIRMQVAVATSLATIIPTSISSARAHHGRGAVDFAIVKQWSVYLLAGSLLGAWIASQVHSNVLAIVFAVFALLVAARMILLRSVTAIRDEVPRSPLIGIVPAAVGCVSSMMGIGGGIFLVMTMSLFGTAIHRAVGTASLFGLVIALPGTIGFIVTGLGDPRMPDGNLGYVSLIGFAFIAPATVLTAPLGARIAHAFDEKKLTLAFGAFLLLVAARLFSQTLSAW